MKTRTFLSCLTIVTTAIVADTTLAQTFPPSVRVPQADNTVGTQVSGTNDIFTVTGGLSRGQTLFHSFTDFSIPTGGTAIFTNPSGTKNIITRVTGNLFSDINGTLNSNGANFLLINPNGIVFGANARLNVGSTFAASTANGVELFGSNGQSYSFATNASGDTPLLTVNPNVSFDISRLNLGASLAGNSGIINYGTLQTNNDRQYIGLIGGNVTLDGGKIIAPGGRVDIGGLTAEGTVSFDDRGLSFGNNLLTRSDVTFTNGASVSVRADKTLGAVNIFTSDVAVLGSNVNIQANNVTFTNAPATQNLAIDAGLETNSGVRTQPTGDINIDATGRVTIDNAIVKNTMRSGNVAQIGDVKITANTVNLTNGAFISTNIAGRGSGGKIQVTTTGDINISGSTPQSTGSSNRESFILSSLDGQGDLGKISIDTQNRGKLILTNNGNIGSSNFSGSIGKSSDISISATAIDLSNGSAIFSSNFGGTGNAGNVAIDTAGDINISGGLPGATGLITPASNLSYISSDTFGLGDSGRITISTQNLGKVSLANYANISSTIYKNANGNSQGIEIVAREVELKNGSSIASANLNGTGNAGNIDIKTVGDVSIYSYSTDLVAPTISDANLSFISSITQGRGNAGKIAIDTGNIGKLTLINRASISNGIGKTAIGNGNDITISARAIDIGNGSSIDAGNIGGFGNAGNIRITTTGDIRIVGFNSFDPDSNKISYISSNTSGTGDAGAISIDTQNRGKVSLTNDGFISSGQSATAVGDSKGISIAASSIDLQNSSILSNNAGGRGNAGDIQIETIGDISLTGSAKISSDTTGTGNAGAIGIDTKNRGEIFLLDGSSIGAGIGTEAIGNGKNLTIFARSMTLDRSIIFSVNGGGRGNAANIFIQTSGDLTIANRSSVVSTNVGKGTTGDINLNSDRIILNQNSTVAAESTGATGGNVRVNTTDKLLLRNSSSIVTNSGSSSLNGNGGNITIGSPFIIALSGNNDISANAYAGNGGNINIFSQGLLGIEYRPTGSSFRNDITASSTFGQSGNVSIITPGIDPGKDSPELPNVPTDASTQIDRSCSPTNRENKFAVTGRGGLPPNASDPLTRDVVWQDPGSAKSQPAVATAIAAPAPPAVGWVFDGKGSVTLVAAGTAGQPTKTDASCLKSIGK
jgi:filamentous hemagglutinin family protein